jgi:hypothetical protein
VIQHGLLALAETTLNTALTGMQDADSSTFYFTGPYTSTNFYVLENILNTIEFKDLPATNLMLALHEGRDAYVRGVRRIEIMRGFQPDTRPGQATQLKQFCGDVSYALEQFRRHIFELRYSAEN